LKEVFPQWLPGSIISSIRTIEVVRTAVPPTKTAAKVPLNPNRAAPGQSLLDSVALTTAVGESLKPANWTVPPRFCNSQHFATYLNNSTTTKKFHSNLVGNRFMASEALEPALAL